LASHGYLVFALDHHDGSCRYTELHNGTPKQFNLAQKPLDIKYKKQQLEIRSNEICDFVDELQKPDFLKSKLGFKEEVCLDLDNLVVSGHSFGGITAIHAA
jgi:predicted dienelactone hydrolase